MGQYNSSNGSTPSAASNSTTAPSITAPFAQQANEQLMAQRYNLSEESWKHHAQARAILSNLIGPNGEQLTSSDPYNTTVFVGGLSPLISEDTLRTFFAPFGEIHYVRFHSSWSLIDSLTLMCVGEGSCGKALWVRTVRAETGCRARHREDAGVPYWR